MRQCICVCETDDIGRGYNDKIKIINTLNFMIASIEIEEDTKYK